MFKSNLVRHLLLTGFVASALSCGSQTDMKAEDTAGHHETIGTLPLPKRLAFMSGHVEAGLALYRAGEPEMAAPHLLHPVSETHADERAGLDTLGFDASLFEAVSAALEAKRPASEIEPQLRAAEANLEHVANRVDADPKDIIRYLMDVLVEEYDMALTNGHISDPGEYQDAFGFAVVARKRAATLPNADVVMAEIDALLALWPEAPIPPATPSSVDTVKARVDAVLNSLGQ